MQTQIDNKDVASNILLLGDYGIQSQFIQREVEKHGHHKFTRKSLSDACAAPPFKQHDIIMVSEFLLAERNWREFIAGATLNADLVVYDVPRCMSEKTLFACPNLKGVLHENAPIEHLLRCLDAVRKGEFWLPRKLMAQMLLHYQPAAMNLQAVSAQDNLTRREKQILERLVKGQSNLEIAEALFVAESTVKTHIYKLYKKLNVCCRKEAIEKFSRTYSA